MSDHYYRPQTKFAKVMFLHLPVSHSVHRGCLPQCMLGYTHPGSRHPWEQTPPPQEQTPLQEQTTSRSRHRPEQTPTPLEQTPQRQTPSWLPREQTHPHPPPTQCMLGDTGNKRAVRILLECILVSNELQDKSQLQCQLNKTHLEKMFLTTHPPL